MQRSWPLTESDNWYDFTASVEGLDRRFAERLEGEAHGISDPAM